MLWENVIKTSSEQFTLSFHLSLFSIMIRKIISTKEIQVKLIYQSSKLSLFDRNIISKFIAYFIDEGSGPVAEVSKLNKMCVMRISKSNFI